MQITFTLNGNAVACEAAADARLLDIIRDTFGLTDTKCGCREGICGACAVLMDGLLVNSCLVPAGNLSGHAITTISNCTCADQAAVTEAVQQTAKAGDGLW